MANLGRLAISLIIPLLIGFLGSFLTTPSVNSDWYSNLNKPHVFPPNWLFAPVWTFLFILIGISFYMVWENNFGKNKSQAVVVYSVQLLLNLLWSFFFFYLQSPFLGLINIIILWFAILLNIKVFYDVSKTAGLLLVPYILWVTFATYLNYSVFILN